MLTYNRADALVLVLRALAPQLGDDCELIIADDGSKPAQVTALRDAVAALSPWPCRVVHVWHPDVGFTAAQARNLGALASSGQRLIFLDGDCVPNPRFMAAQRALARPGWFVNGSRVLLDATLTQQVLEQPHRLLQARWPDWLRWRLRGQANKQLHALWPGAARARELPGFVWKQIRSCNFALDRQDFERVNGFDETFAGWGHEDADLVLRLHHAGLKRLNAWLGAEVYHLWHAQQARQAEQDNRATVRQRQGSGLVRALRGLDAHLETTDAVVTVLC
ncbi:MAG: glycosyltransferase family 2 protein [Rhodoferax sp.]